MKKVFILIVGSLFITMGAFANDPVVKGGAPAKKLYGSLKKISGELCNSSVCAVTGSKINQCMYMSLGDAYWCNLLDSTITEGTINGDDAKELYEALSGFQRPECNMGSCVLVTGITECTLKDSNYECKVQVANPALAFTENLSLTSTEITKEGSAAKTIYKTVKDAIGEKCEGDTCKVNVGSLMGCQEIVYAVNYYVCTIPDINNMGHVITLTGFTGAARALYGALKEFQKPACQIMMCAVLLGPLECTAQGNWFKDYKCKAQVSEF